MNSIWMGLAVGILIGRIFEVWATWYSKKAVTEEKSTASVVPSSKKPKAKDVFHGDAYCVKCKDKTAFEGIIRTSDSGRQMATGNCPRCGTKVNRILGKVAL